MTRPRKTRWSILNNPSLGSFAASMFSQGMLLLSGPASARLLGVTGRGEYALLIIIATIASFFGGAGLPTAVAYALASQHVSARYIFSVIASAWLCLCLGAGSVSALAVFLVVRGDTSSPRWLEAALVAAYVMASMTYQLVLAGIQGQHHFRALNLVRVIFVTTSAVILVLLWLVLRHAVAAVALAVSTGALIAACLVGGAFLALRPRAPNVGVGVSMRSLMRYGLASLAGNNAPLESLQIDQAVVGLFLSRYALGLYAVGSAFDNLPGILVSGVGMIALPRLAGAPSRESRNAIMKRALLLAVAFSGAATVVAEAVVGWLLPAAFGVAFTGAVAPARVLILSGFLMGMRRIFVVFLQGVGRPGHTGVGEALALVTFLLLAALLVPVLGILGASLSFLGGAIAANLYLLWALRHQAGAPTSPQPPVALADV